MAWKPEVFVGNDWCRNGLAFATEAEALNSANDLMYRWMNVKEARAVEVEGMPVSHSYIDGELRFLPPPALEVE